MMRTRSRSACRLGSYRRPHCTCVHLHVCGRSGATFRPFGVGQVSFDDPRTFLFVAFGLYVWMVLDLLQKVWTSGGIQVSETATLMCGAWQKRMLTAEFITKKNYREQTRNVAGVSVTTIETDFGTLNVMLNRYMPSDAVEVGSLDQCAPVLLETPGKGFLFSEPLAKTGSVDKAQIYGEIGLENGPENAHGKITGLTVAGA